MNRDPDVKNLYHTFNCCVCGREVTLFSVHEPNKQSPCSMECLKKQRKDEENGKNNH